MKKILTITRKPKKILELIKRSTSNRRVSPKKIARGFGTNYI